MQEEKRGYRALPHEGLSQMCRDIFAGYGFTPAQADDITRVLLCADLFGIESHGVQRMMRYHQEIGAGAVEIAAEPAVVHQTPVSAVVDARRAMGQLAGVQAMALAIEKAEQSGIGMVAVRGSNHYGIAGYYALMAAERDLMGVCMTNSEAIGVPTYGRAAALGTNPIALAFPAAPVPFLYDAATTVVPRGKLEVYNKNGRPLPDGWAVNAEGLPTADAGEVLHNIINKAGGGIAPLGGAGEEQGGHKGYGLGIMVDLFTAVLSGGSTSNHVNLQPDRVGITHFFMAMDYGLFGEKAAVKQRMTDFLQELRAMPKAAGQGRIYTHGEKEFESRAEKLKSGVPVNEKTMAELREIAQAQGLNAGDYLPGL